MASFLGINMGSFNLGNLNLKGYVGIVIYVVLGLIIIGTLIWLTYSLKVYNRKVTLFENIAGRGYQPIFKDRARLIRLGDGGEELLWLKKTKVYRTAYGSKMGLNEYWFAKGQDGYWYNFVLGDLDAKMGTLDIEPIDRDMRYMHTAIRKNIQQRYNKQGFMDKYGSWIMAGTFVIIMLLGLWFLLGKMGNSAEILASTAQTNLEVLKLNQQVLTGLENVCNGGTGLVPS